jgi:glutaconate CoA-transferase subunit B
MTVAAARELPDGAVCFVGIGLPSAAACLARSIHAPSLVMIYESGPIGSKPAVLPLSIGDAVLAQTADTVVTIPEIFNYWLQSGRIQIGFLGAAQVDRFGNLNSTIVGDRYQTPATRLPGAGGAPEIASSCGEVYVVMAQSRRSFVERLDFVTSVGLGTGRGDRERLGLRGGGPSRIITDLGILRPMPRTGEFQLVAIHPGVSIAEVRKSTGWPLRVARDLARIPPPTELELSTLRQLAVTSTD